MSVESFILFVMKNNTALIEGLVVLILLSALYLAWRGLKAPPEGAGAGLSNFADLEETLKKLLEKAAVVPAVGDAHAGGAPTELLAEIANLKKGLEERQIEIENLKNSNANAPAGAAGGGMSDDERAKLELQIKELQGKLAEYEIISEDIADLSFYKEENAKLQKQLEAAKAAGGAAPAPATPKLSIPADAPGLAGLEAVATEIATPAPAAAPEPVLEAAMPPPAPTPAPVEEAGGGIDDDLMAEFAAAVESQKAGTIEDTSPVPAPAPAPVPQAEPPAPAQPAAAASGETETAADLGSMDMDKMLAEAEGITSAPEVAEAPNALEASADPDKLIQEASSLPEVKPEDETLMNEFENFVKKGS